MRLPWPRRPAPSLPLAPTPPSDLDHLPDWLARLFPGAPDLDETVAALGHMLRAAPSSALGRLDARARRWRRWDDAGWRSVTPADVHELVQTADPLAVAAATSMHRSGYVREAAVGVLATMSAGDELRWLLLRCTDWVPTVRNAAIDAVRARGGSSGDRRYAGELVRAVALIDSEQFDAEELGALRRELHSALASPASRDALREAARDPDRPTRRAAVRILVRVEPTIELLRGQLAVGDVVTATSVGSELLARQDVADETAQFLLGSGMARPRELGLWHVITQGHATESLLDACLVDPAPRVRDIAQRHAAGGGRDVAGWYRERLSEEPLGALLGLGDIGGPQDIPAAEAYIRSEHARTRAASVRVIARFGSPTELPRLLDVATQDSGRVAREALAALRRHRVSDEIARDAWVRATDLTSPQAGRRRIFVRVLTLASRWVATELAVKALIDPDESTRELGAALLAHTATTWNDSWTTPTPRQLDVVKELVEQAHGASRPDEHRALLDDFGDIVARWR
jgi:HEAT repeat protein